MFRRNPLRSLLLLLLLPALWGCIHPVAADQAPRVDQVPQNAVTPPPARAEPPPVLADDYRDFCRGQPSGCLQDYQRYQTPFREDRAEQRMDRLRERGQRLQYLERRGLR